MTTKYITKHDASVVQERKSAIIEHELERIHKERGALIPTDVIEEATSPDSPLHKYFEWDESKAAHKYRLQQATQMILASKFVCVLQENTDRLPEVVHAKATEHVVRSFLPVGDRGEGFAPRIKVLEDVDQRLVLVERKKEALRSWCRSVVDIEELSGLRNTIEKALVEMNEPPTN